MSNKIPNLDGLTEGELRRFHRTYYKCTAKKAASLIGDRRLHFLSVARQLARYARLKAEAMPLRSEGCLTLAKHLEADAEKIYNSLPQDLRW